jgi:hypothetical protein
VPLAGQGLHLAAVALAERNAHLLVLDAVAA